MKQLAHKLVTLGQTLHITNTAVILDIIPYLGVLKEHFGNIHFSNMLRWRKPQVMENVHNNNHVYCNTLSSETF